MASNTTEGSVGLTPEQVKFWETNGYLVVPDVLSTSTCESLLKESQRLIDGFTLDDHPMTQFSTGENGRGHVGDEYFLGSGDKVRFFFEEDAIDPETHALTRPLSLSINKIGHYLHEASAAFRKVTFSSLHAGIARALGFRDPRILQSMLIYKQPQIGGRVPPHQDSTFLYTNPPSAVGFWLALEDADVDNGCLAFVSGSHKTSPIHKRFVRLPQRGESGTGFVDLEPAMFPTGPATQVEHENKKEDKYVLAPVKAGSLVLIHGNLVHKSERNVSDKSRLIYTFHVIEGTQVYDDDNWLQMPGGPAQFSKLYEETKCNDENVLKYD